MMILDFWIGNNLNSKSKYDNLKERITSRHFGVGMPECSNAFHRITTVLNKPHQF